MNLWGIALSLLGALLYSYVSLGGVRNFQTVSQTNGSQKDQEPQLRRATRLTTEVLVVRSYLLVSTLSWYMSGLWPTY
eukprot:3509649-Amphidinium_carterae.1